MDSPTSSDSLVNRRTILFLWLATIITISITFLLVYFKKSDTSEPVALHYNVITGVDVLGKAYNLYQLPLAALVIAIANFALSYVLIRRAEFLSFLMPLVSLIAALLLFIGAFFILTIG